MLVRQVSWAASVHPFKCRCPALVCGVLTMAQRVSRSWHIAQRGSRSWHIVGGVLWFRFQYKTWPNIHLNHSNVDVNACLFFRGSLFGVKQKHEPVRCGCDVFVFQGIKETRGQASPEFMDVYNVWEEHFRGKPVRTFWTIHSGSEKHLAVGQNQWDPILVGR